VYLEIDKATALRENPFRMHSAEGAARGILAGVARNRAVIVLSPQAKLMWHAYRLSPAIYQLGATLAVRTLRRRVRAR
jgi:short-subunit dehydrogenase